MRLFLERILFVVSFIALGVMVYDEGFHQHQTQERHLDNFYFFIMVILLIAQGILVYRHHSVLFVDRSKKIGYALISLNFVVVIAQVFHLLGFENSIVTLLNHYFFTFFILFFIFLFELSKFTINIGNWRLNTPVLFAASFLIVILLGTLSLMLPTATTNGISFTDALFTSTSAVCVTGLIVLDTSKDFTGQGQHIIMFLIQLGGLGMMTFTSFFGFFFRGDTSFGNRLMLRWLTRSSTLNNVFQTIIRIILVTFGIELVGAFLIFESLLYTDFGFWEKIHFSVFHAISAFCNAGFSTLSDGLYDEAVRGNYLLHLFIAFLFIFGGLGFPILFNIFNYFKHIIKIYYTKWILGQRPHARPRLINLNTQLIIYTTITLLIIGTLGIWVAERNHSLQDLTWNEQISTAFFAAATPRTAGFNTIDMTNLAMPTILITMVLMWIGASPGSTGGGIKTSTFAVAMLNVIGVARQKKQIELKGRAIAATSVNRAFAVITLSLLTIGITIFLLSLFETDKAWLSLAFEAISAYATVGLSMGITNELSEASKIVLIFTMFIGRVSLLTLIIGIVRDASNRSYKYPTESILIN